MDISHTKSYYEAMKAGTRILELTEMDTDMMIRLIGKTNYQSRYMLSKKLTELTMCARKVKIVTKEEVILEFVNNSSRPVFHSDGILRERGDL